MVLLAIAKSSFGLRLLRRSKIRKPMATALAVASMLASPVGAECATILVPLMPFDLLPKISAGLSHSVPSEL